MQKHAHCLVCGSSEYGVMPESYAHAYLVKCTECGFVFSVRVPSEQELTEHYGKYPRNTGISALTVKRYEELLEEFEPYRRTNRLLDIGCGDGHFLSVAKSKGWEVYGTEYTQEAVNICRAKGIHMQQGVIQQWSGPDSFDVITSFEVLEHITDGREHARKIHSLLRTGGLFYFTTPNFNSFSRRWLQGKWKIIEYPEHLSYYTATTITRLLTDAGLKRRTVLSTGLTLRRFPSEASNYVQNEEALRNTIEQRRALRLVKKFVNSLLTTFNAGDTLKGYFVK